MFSAAWRVGARIAANKDVEARMTRVRRVMACQANRLPHWTAERLYR